MSELAETTDFLSSHDPWALLERRRVGAFAKRAVGRYVRRGSVVLAAGEPSTAMHVVRAGAIEVTDADGTLVTHEEEGSCFGQSSILEDRPSRFTFTAVEDTLLWSFPPDVVHELVEAEQVRRFFTESRLRDVGRSAPEGGPVLRVPVSDMLTRAPVTIDVTATVGDAARVMDDAKISAIIITRGEDLAGILTDRDLRRVVAQALPGDTPLAEVMSTSPTTIGHDALALDVLLSLVEQGIHHLPVLEGTRIAGMVTSGDLMRLERSSPLYLVGDLARQADVAGLAGVMGRLPALVARLLRQDALAADITRIVSRTTDALWQRLLALAEERLGPAPVPYCWVALGSLARHEQALASDQDHALILADDATPAHDDYFAALATTITESLTRCGFERCKGDAMATSWRMPLRQWWRVFSGWLAAPTAEAVLNSSIFFDMRPVHGDAALFHELRRRIVAAAPTATRFLGHLARHAGDIDVPIGFLRGLVVQKHGAHRDRLDVKHGGLTPVVDVARVHALRWGITHVGTRARLEAAAEHGTQTDNLLEAFELLSYVRLEHQSRLVAEGREPDNFIDPRRLTDFERRQVREAFAIVGRAQGALDVTFQTQFFS